MCDEMPKMNSISFFINLLVSTTWYWDLICKLLNQSKILIVWSFHDYITVLRVDRRYNTIFSCHTRSVSIIISTASDDRCFIEFAHPHLTPKYVKKYLIPELIGGPYRDRPSSIKPMQLDARRCTSGRWWCCNR